MPATLSIKRRPLRRVRLFCSALLLLLAPLSPALSAAAKPDDAVIQSTYGMAWEQIPAAPKPVSRVLPRYSRNTHQPENESVVRAVFRIDADGRVEGLKCFCETDRRLVSESEAALVRWRFPKERGGPYRLTITIRRMGNEGGLSLGFE